MNAQEARETLAETRSSAAKIYMAFWEPKETSVDDNQRENATGNDTADNEALKTLSGSSSLDNDGGSCGPGDDAFCFSNFLWLIAAGLVAYYGEFVDAVIVMPLFGAAEEINSPCYWIGVALLFINLAIFYYLVVHLSWNRGVKSDDWDSYVPFAVPLATASFVGAALFLSLGLWPQYGVLTVPILSTVFMGFIVIVSMASQTFKWMRWRAEAEKDKKLS